MASVMKRDFRPSAAAVQPDENDRIRSLSDSELEWKHRINEK